MPVPACPLEEQLALFEKRCRRCGAVKIALTEFYAHKQTRDRFDTQCKSCANAASKRRHAARGDDPERKAQVAAATRRAYERTCADPEKLAKRRATTAAWRAANPDKTTEQYRAWRLANAERVREKNHRRRATLLGAFVAPVDPDVIWERDRGTCQLCETPIDRSLPWPDRWCVTLDHVIPLSRGGTHEPSNVQLAHHVCNSRKNDRPA